MIGVVSEYSLTMNRIKKPPLHPQQKSRTSANQRQASLINAAASLFAANGFTGTTTRRIAKAAGVSEALLFKYFPTKQDDVRLFTLPASYLKKRS